MAICLEIGVFAGQEHAPSHPFAASFAARCNDGMRTARDMRRPLAAALSVLTLASPVFAGVIEDCVQASDRELQISACTEAIESGQWEGAALAWAYGNRGNAWQALRDPTRAVADYSKALELDPDFPMTWHNRGLVFAALGDYARALADYNEALARDPDFTAALGSRGVAYREMGEPQKALADLDRAIAIDPDAARHYQNRANVRCTLGDIDGSVQDRLRAIRLGHFEASLVQSVLTEKGFYDGPVDGAFGIGSVEALREWTEKGCE